MKEVPVQQRSVSKKASGTSLSKEKPQTSGIGSKKNSTLLQKESSNVIFGSKKQSTNSIPPKAASSISPAGISSKKFSVKENARMAGGSK